MEVQISLVKKKMIKMLTPQLSGADLFLPHGICISTLELLVLAHFLPCSSMDILEVRVQGITIAISYGHRQIRHPTRPRHISVAVSATAVGETTRGYCRYRTRMPRSCAVDAACGVTKKFAHKTSIRRGTSEAPRKYFPIPSEGKVHLGGNSPIPGCDMISRRQHT